MFTLHVQLRTCLSYKPSTSRGKQNSTNKTGRPLEPFIPIEQTEKFANVVVKDLG